MQAIATMMSIPGAAPTGASHADVLSHLQRLFNSRRGQSTAAPSYGLALSIDVLRDMLTLLPQTMAHIEGAVLATANAHEPRIKNLRLREPTALHAHALTLHTVAQCCATAADVAFDVHIAPSGRVFVKRP